MDAFFTIIHCNIVKFLKKINNEETNFIKLLQLQIQIIYNMIYYIFNIILAFRPLIVYFVYSFYILAENIIQFLVEDSRQRHMKKILLYQVTILVIKILTILIFFRYIGLYYVLFYTIRMIAATNELCSMLISWSVKI